MDHRLLYDAECGLCRAVTGVILWLDRDERLRPVALQSAEAAELLGDMTAQERMASFHLVSPEGRRSSAGPALAELTALLRGHTGATRGPVGHRRLADWGYQAVARNRIRLGPLVPGRLRAWADAQIDRRR